MSDYYLPITPKELVKERMNVSLAMSLVSLCVSCALCYNISQSFKVNDCTVYMSLLQHDCNFSEVLYMAATEVWTSVDCF